MRISEDDFDKVIEVNLKSVFNMTKAVIRPMMKQRAGSIINMSSVVGLKEMLVNLIMQLLKLVF